MAARRGKPDPTDPDPLVTEIGLCLRLGIGRKALYEEEDRFVQAAVLYMNTELEEQVKRSQESERELKQRLEEMKK